MKANTTGRAAEDILAGVMVAMGIAFDQQCVIGETIYHKRLRVDFVLHNIASFPRGLIVESKWQDVGGTADEKFPYLVENIYQAYPLPAMVVIHGGGCCPGALAYIRKRVNGQQFVAVYSLEEFVSWALRVEKLSSVLR